MAYQKNQAIACRYRHQYTEKRKAVDEEIQKMEAKALKEGRIAPNDEKHLTELYKEAEFLKNKHGRSIERLKT